MARIGGNEVWLDWGGFACLTCACCWFLVRCAGAWDFRGVDLVSGMP